jgi:hypothetical protein
MGICLSIVLRTQRILLQRVHVSVLRVHQQFVSSIIESIPRPHYVESRKFFVADVALLVSLTDFSPVTNV